jgi:sterol desaturase/sphingolipid hydroxylase (fatty acid hydroxylase superfamily)
MLIILVDIFIIFIALILLNPLLVLLFILVSSVLKGIHNHLNVKQKLNKIKKIYNHTKTS